MDAAAAAAHYALSHAPPPAVTVRQQEASSKKRFASASVFGLSELSVGHGTDAVTVNTLRDCRGGGQI